MRVFYDFEFMEDGRTLDIISLGMVTETGKELYVQSSEFDERNANDWVKAHVLPHLQLCPCCGHQCNHEQGKCRHPGCPWRTRVQIKSDILAFVGDTPIELWGYYSSYDHVALCQLFGPMINLPTGWPMWTNDLMQWSLAMHLTKELDVCVPQTDAHQALADAQWNKRAWEYLASL